MRYSCVFGLYLGLFAGAVCADASPVLLFPGVPAEAGNTSSGTSVVLSNRTLAPQSVLLELLPRGGAIPSASRSILLAPGETQEVADLHAFLGAAGGLGMLRVTGASAAQVRLRNPDDEFILRELPAFTPEQAIGPNEEADFPYSTPADVEREDQSNLILLNLEARDVTVTLSQGSIRAMKTIPAGAFVQIDNLGRFLGTPPGIASAHAVADGRWFGSVMAVRPLATQHKRRAVGPPPKLPSSATLIDKALAARTINAEQALTYKVFADFGDPRLPAAFRGDDSGTIEADSTGLAVQAWPTLSPATQDLIGPYLVPAFYEGSWWSLRDAGNVSVSSPPCAWYALETCSILTDWGHVDGLHVRVWYDKSHPEDNFVASDLVHETDVKIWPELIKVMGREPLLEHEMAGTKLLDVVMVDNLGSGKLATTLSLNLNCAKGTTFVLVNRNTAYIDSRRSAFAHELFHSVQFSYFLQGCPIESKWKWLMESTATWFEDELYPKVNREHPFAKHYLSFPELSIDATSGLDGDGIKQRNYGAYTFFFYVTRFGGGDPNTVVRNVWEATKGGDALHALKAGLETSKVPLEKSWPGFALYSFNRDAPFNRYDTEDQLSTRAEIQKSETVSVPKGDDKVDLGDTEMTLPHLSMRYFRVDFPDDTAATLAFYNGIQRALNPVDSSWTEFGFGRVVSAEKVGDPASIKGAHVQALLKIDGKWTSDDWTDKPFKTYCRDLKSERIESLIIILSNSDIENTLQPQGQYPPILQVTNIGCYAWEGTVKLTFEDDGRVEKMTVSDLLLKARGDVPDSEETPLRRMFSPVGGTFHWSISGSTDGCGWQAADQEGTLSTNSGEFYTFPYAQSPAPGARGVLPILFQEWLFPRRIVNSVGGPMCEAPVGNWSALAFYPVGLLPTDSHAQVSENGRSYTLDAPKLDTGVTGTWTFTAKRE